MGLQAFLFIVPLSGAVRLWLDLWLGVPFGSIDSFGWSSFITLSDLSRGPHKLLECCTILQMLCKKVFIHLFCERFIIIVLNSRTFLPLALFLPRFWRYF